MPDTVSRKPRILYCAWTPPSENGGACLAMRRHFIEHDDFELSIVTPSRFEHADFSTLSVKRHPVLVRLSNTRFCRLLCNFEMMVESSLVPSCVWKRALEFQPDAVFTVPDNTLSWVAYQVARKLGVPLITNFQDWWPRGQFVYEWAKPYPLVRALLERRFRKMFRESKVAFCTSEGMRDKLGAHPSAPVLYPCPAQREPDFTPDFQTPSPGVPLRLVYAGTIIKSYGRSVLRLAKALSGCSWIRFEVYGPKPDWPEEDRIWMESEGIYKGLLPFQELKSRLRSADACLAVMSFDPELELMMRTSFTTKFLEYAQFAKPIIIWGPEYSQPVQVARETGAGLTVPNDDVESVLEAIASLRSQPAWNRYARGAWTAAQGIFDHAVIHKILRTGIEGCLNRENFEFLGNG